MSHSVVMLYAALCGFILLFLSWRVTRCRMKYQVSLGDGGHPELARAIRVHSNFVEYTPLALLLILLVELSGFSPWVIHGLGVALVVGRILHAQGLGSSAGRSVGRFYGTLLTWSTILAAAVLGLLALASVRI